MEFNRAYTYYSTHEGIVYFVQPSNKYPGCWWVSKIVMGVWEGFSRPLTQAGFEYWLTTLPQDVGWNSEKWDGREMTVPAENPTVEYAPQRVYFFEAVGLNMVKIGLTRGDVTQRLRAVGKLCPVELRVIGEIEGDARVEHSLHKRFKDFRIRGEWFKLVPEIQTYIKEYA